MNLKLIKASILFLMLGLSLHSIGQNRYHVDETIYDRDSSKLKSTNELITGVVYDQYENGQLKIEANLKDGKEEGLWKYWHENGQLKIEANFKDGNRDGLYKDWYESGQLENKGNFKDGKEDGLWKKWHENGQLKVEENFKDGNRDG